MWLVLVNLTSWNNINGDQYDTDHHVPLGSDRYLKSGFPMLVCFYQREALIDSDWKFVRHKFAKGKRTWDLHCLLFTFSATNTHGCIVWYEAALGRKIWCSTSSHSSQEVKSQWAFASGKQTPSPWDCWANRQHQRYISGLNRSPAADEHTHDYEQQSLSDATPPSMTVQNKIQCPMQRPDECPIPITCTASVI